MSDYIIIYYKDGSRFETNKLIAITFMCDELIVMFRGIFDEIDSKVIDGTLVDRIEVKRGNN